MVHSGSESVSESESKGIGVDSDTDSDPDPEINQITVYPPEQLPLIRVPHQVSTAAADPGMSTALRSVGLLDVLSSTPAEPSRRAPCIHARLRRLATKPVEKCGPAIDAIFSRHTACGGNPEGQKAGDCTEEPHMPTAGRRRRL